MNKLATSKDSSDKKLSWRMSIDDKNGIHTSVSVEKLDNEGYLVCVNKYGSNKSGKYIDENKKYYSLINPLEGKSQSEEEKKEKELNINNIFDKWSDMLDS